jgi:hypothetical protein
MAGLTEAGEPETRRKRSDSVRLNRITGIRMEGFQDELSQWSEC